MMTEEKSTEVEVTTSSIDKIKDMFEGSWEPEIIEDSAGLDFDSPIKGKYICRIAGLERRVGVGKESGKPYDFFALKLQAEEDVEGDRSGNRYLDKTYFVGTSQFSDDPDLGIKRLFNDLFTAGALDGVTVDSKDKYEVAESIGPQIQDKLVNVTAWKSKSGKQTVKVVNTHKLKDKKEDVAGESSW